MDYQFTVALDQPAAVRNMEATATDDFTVAVSFYETDGAATKLSLTGATAALSLDRACGVDAAIAGALADGVATFDFADTDLAPLVGRNVWRVALVRAGKTVTVLRGILTVTR